MRKLTTSIFGAILLLTTLSGTVLPSAPPPRSTPLPPVLLRTGDSWQSVTADEAVGALTEPSSGKRGLRRLLPW
jgi:hypothetical protein